MKKILLILIIGTILIGCGKGFDKEKDLKHIVKVLNDSITDFNNEDLDSFKNHWLIDENPEAINIVKSKQMFDNYNISVEILDSKFIEFNKKEKAVLLEVKEKVIFTEKNIKFINKYLYIFKKVNNQWKILSKTTTEKNI